MLKYALLAVLLVGLLLGGNLVSFSYSISQNDNGSVSYVGKVNISQLPKTKGHQHNFTMPFLPQSQSAYNEAKSKPKSIHLNNTMIESPASPFSSIVKTSNKISVVSHFDGLGQDQCNCSPPDVQVAVGPDNIVEMVNTSEEIWTKQDKPITSISLYAFYSVPSSDFLSDPRIFYDPTSDRWFSSILDVSTDSVKVGVSDSNDPAKAWNIYNVSFGANCPDQPAIAAGGDKLVVSANDFANCLTFPTLVGAQYFVINKTQLVLGDQNPSMQSFGPDVTAFSIMPSTPLGFSKDLYMVSAYGNSGDLKLYSISGNLPSVKVHSTDLKIRTINIPPSAIQNGTSTSLQTNDDRILDAVWNDGNLWFSLTDSCTPLGDSQARSCVRLVELDTSTSQVMQDFDIGSTGFYYFYPAITVDGNNNLDTIFGYSSSKTYPGLMFATQTSLDGLDRMGQIQTIQVGSSPDTSGRYGDYFAASRDPSNATSVYVAGEFHSSGSSSSPWDTYVGNTNYVSAPEFPIATAMFLISMISLFLVMRSAHFKNIISNQF